MMNPKDNLWRILMAAGLTVALAGFTGCDVSSDDEGDTGGAAESDGTDDATGGDVLDEGDATDVVVDTGPHYYAIQVVDGFDYDGCGTADEAGCCGSKHATKMAPGADIDSVEMIAGDGTDTSWFFGWVDGDVPTDSDKCSANAYANMDKALGAPFVPTADQLADEGAIFVDEFVSLHGGWIIGEFVANDDADSAIEIYEGDTIKVWDIGPAHDFIEKGKDEPMKVWIALDMTCMDEADPAACRILLSDSAEGTASIDVPAL